jgi:hypothetical protein
MSETLGLIIALFAALIGLALMAGGFLLMDIHRKEGKMYNNQDDETRFTNKSNLSRWVTIEDSPPKPLQLIYVVCENTDINGNTKRYQTIGQYIPRLTVNSEDYMDSDLDCDYNEEDDTYYVPSGFYEYQIESDCMWYISSKVTHWMPLFALS